MGILSSRRQGLARCKRKIPMFMESCSASAFLFLSYSLTWKNNPTLRHLQSRTLWSPDLLYVEYHSYTAQQPASRNTVWISRPQIQYKYSLKTNKIIRWFFISQLSGSIIGLDYNILVLYITCLFELCEREGRRCMQIIKRCFKIRTAEVCNVFYLQWLSHEIPACMGEKKKKKR